MLSIDNKGVISLTGLMLLSSLSFLFLFYVVKKKKDHSFLRKNMVQILCVKEAHGVLKNFIQVIEFNNYLITISKPLTNVPNPAIRIPAILIFEGAKVFQKLSLLSFLKKKANFIFGECAEYTYLLENPYNTTGKVFFKRKSYLKTAVLRKEEWKKSIRIGYQKATVLYIVEGGLEMKIEKKKASHLSKLW